MSLEQVQRETERNKRLKLIYWQYETSNILQLAYLHWHKIQTNTVTEWAEISQTHTWVFNISCLFILSTVPEYQENTLQAQRKKERLVLFVLAEREWVCV